jgi:predicted DNA-binding protein
MVNHSGNEKRNKKERKDGTVVFRLSEDDKIVLEYLSYRLGRSKSEIVRQALKLYDFAMSDKLK